MKKVTTLIASIILFTSFSTTFAESKTFIKEYTYQASEDDSRNSSRTLALLEVKRLLLEELGTYLESVTEVQNFQLSKDRITALTAGIVQTEIMADKWDGDNLKYWLKAKIVVDSNQVIKSIDALRNDRAKTKELEEIRRRSDELLRENQRLRKELSVATVEQKPKEIAAYNKTIKDLLAIEWFEKGYTAVFTSNNERNYNDAIDAYSKAIELNPNYADAYLFRGFAFSVLLKYGEAIKDFDKAIKLNPKDEWAYNNRGQSNWYLGNYNQAMKDFSKAIEFNPKDEILYNLRGITYDKLGKYNQAIKDFNKSIDLNPQNAMSYFSRGVAYANLGNYQKALRDYDRAIELTPKFGMANYNRGIAYEHLGYHQKSINEIKIAARLGITVAQDYLRSRGIEWKVP